ncbi:MAG TPA: type II secretion system F family protein [Symbiobacteriaceae bacterium]|nr:type II secretion system F family protein [Symbiobacteriaceae bacterium]
MVLLIALLVAAAVGLVLLPSPQPATDWGTPEAAAGISLMDRLVGHLAASSVARDLPLSGMPLTVEQLAAKKIRLTLIAGSACLLFWVLGMSKLALIALLAGVWAFKGPDLDVARKAAVYRAAIQRELPSFLFTLAIMAEAGVQLLPALEYYCRSSNTKLGAELQRALTEVQLGQAPAVALMEMAQYLDVKDLTFFVGALVQSLERGGDGLVRTLRMQAEAGWDKRKRSAQELGHKASAKLFIPLVLFVLPAIVAIAVGPAVLSFLRSFLG